MKRRIHAFELEDQPWLPRTIRDFATDFLQFMIERTDAYRPVAPHIRRALYESGARRIVDLGSGGGGPWLRLRRQIAGDAGAVEVLLTDRFPSRGAMERIRRAGDDRLSYHPEPVDAMRVPGELTGFRTMFTALHHFRPEDARAILEDAVRTRQGIGAFESSERSTRGLVMMLLSPVLVLLVTPFLRPFRWSRLFWTYVVPVVPLLVVVDGTMSCLRTYTLDELREIVGPLESDDYQWEVGAARGRAPIPVLYVLGRPRTTLQADPSGG